MPLSRLIFSKPPRAALAAIAAFSLIACGGQSASGGEASADTADVPEAGAVSATDMVLGAADAPVTVIEFASVTCPACAAFHLQFLPEIKENYVDTGKVKFVFREFPTPPARLSVIGSVLARCAAEKSGADGYFAIIGSLMGKQRDWVAQGADHKAELLKITGQAGIEEPAFDACLQRQDLVDLIYANVKEAEETFQINSTPSFIINGESKRLRSLEEWSEALDAAYAAATGKASDAPDEPPAEQG